MSVRPARGAGHPTPDELSAGEIAVASYVGPGRDDVGGGGWRLECFVSGTDLTLRAARREAREWLGQSRAVLLATKVGGASSEVKVTEQAPPPPPEYIERDYDPEVDAPIESGGDVGPVGPPAEVAPPAEAGS